MKASRVVSASVIALALAVPLALMARPDAITDVPAAPSADQVAASKLVYGLLSDSRYAYRPRAMDATMSSEIFDSYFENLDAGKLFFTRQDVSRFEPLRSRMGVAVRNGEIAPALEIFALYKTRVAERTQYARDLLGQDIFDFSGNDRWEYDRKDAEWASDPAELDALWRQSVRNDWLRLQLAGKTPEDIRKTLDRRYLNMGNTVASLNEEDAFSSFLNAYTGAIDPHTDYFNPRAARLFNQNMSLSLEGIGAQLQKQDDVVVIREVIAGGPAALSNRFKPGDRIVGVGQGTSGPMEDVVGWRIDDVVEKIKGPKDTQVRLDVVPAEATLDSEPVRITLTRARVRLEEQAAKAQTLTLPADEAGGREKQIGVIKLPAFYQDFEGRRSRNGEYASATRDVARLLEEFKAKRVDGVVLDLRNNGGGSLNEAVELTGLFIDQGPVVQVRESGGRVGVQADRDPGVAWDGPLAVLINRGSASASEIVAGAIQDYGRGLIIGETTFGKGTVQNLVDLDRWPANETQRYGQVKLTIAQFFLPGGSSTQNKGVEPDIHFPVTVDATEFGESTYDNALPWTRIAAVPHTQYGDFSSLLPKLEASHEARVATDREFVWWAEDIAEFRAEREKKYVSLNEAERRAERDRQAERRQARQEERRALGLELDPLADDSSDDGLQASERAIAQQNRLEKAAEERPDPLLRESAAILADAVRLLNADRQLSATVLPVSTAPGRWAR
ncbi:carboxy terminal-processing peptidase [Luteimonas sp BLCC-B24]|uniref:carboxy terminal-processing peptidase n=1 Tax=Luteimonas sp. BLCC-B24 TaxID=3025317 RepID=UPI00234D2642|nr:carboxy terminal-processing peptidase [Luteimonas sp. BLCC-B24]MDC7807398.1 carboxy terminal-processing peptidase [Luteimonas sp. BLCC-B24]